LRISCVMIMQRRLIKFVTRTEKVTEMEDTIKGAERTDCPPSGKKDSESSRNEFGSNK
jgi:hypothetical protein